MHSISRFESSEFASSTEELEFPSSAPPSEQILWASENGKVDKILELIEKDATLVNSKDKDEYTPLHRAAYNNQLDAIKVLLEAGSLIDPQTIDGWTPLHSACNWNNYESASLLIDEGANVNAQTNSGQTPLHLAASNRNAKETLQLLLMNFQTDTSIVNSSNESAEQIAIRHGPYSYMFEGHSPILIPSTP